MSAESVFWLWAAAAVFAATAVYSIEVYRFGGMGMGTPCVFGVIVYSLLNPALYIISPALTPNFALYLGWDYGPARLIPNAASVCLFITGVGISSICGRRLARQHRVPSQGLTPLRHRQLNTLITLGVGCIAIGLAMYGMRNYVEYGSPLASITTRYSGAEARPQVVVWSAYRTVLSWGVMALSAGILWQVSAGRLSRLLVPVPILCGTVLAVIEGDRTVATTAVMFALGWWLLQKRIGFRHMAVAFALVTFLTVLASARYFKAEHGFVERLGDIVNPENFRPFWSSDPVGPAIVATLEVERVGEGTRLALGEDYFTNVAAVIPRALWADKPDDSATRFSKWYADYFGREYFAGTGFAYSMVTEAFVNFWYPGALFFGLVWGALASKVNILCICRRDRAGRLAFAGLISVLPMALSRGYLAALVSPTSVLTYCVIGAICRRVGARKRGEEANLRIESG